MASAKPNLHFIGIFYSATPYSSHPWEGKITGCCRELIVVERLNIYENCTLGNQKSRYYREVVVADDRSLRFHCIQYHYENTPIQIYRKFHLQKLKTFR